MRRRKHKPWSNTGADTSQYAAGSRVIERFESVEAFARIVGGVKSKFDSHYQRPESGWSDMGIDEALNCSVNGLSSLVAAAETNVDKLCLDQTDTGLRSRMIPAIVGSRVSVPDYLAGSPTCMRRRMRVEAQTRHVNVYVCLNAYGGYSQYEMLQRGQAILALLQYLQSTQIGVDLYLTCELGGKTNSNSWEADFDFWTLIKVESQPLDLGISGFAVAHPSFLRMLCFGYANHKAGFDGSFCPTLVRHNRKRSSAGYITEVREAFGVAPEDIYVPGVCSGDYFNPETWVRDTINQVMQ